MERENSHDFFLSFLPQTEQNKEVPAFRVIRIYTTSVEVETVSCAIN